MLLMVAGAVGLVVAIVVLTVGYRRRRDAREYADNSIDVELLHRLMQTDEAVRLFDVRQPLDLLAYSEMIPGARRVAPKEVEADPALIPKDVDVVIYCTCGGQETSLQIVRRARSLGYSRVKLLDGGLAAWKAKGYPVEIYRESFRLDTAV